MRPNSLLRSLQTMSSTNKPVSISSLPLPPRTHLLPSNLTPDPHTPTPSTFLHEVLTQKPSIQRRARLLSPQSHFSYVAPLPLPFPYDIRASDSKDVGDKPDDRAAYVERWLSMREATHAHSQEGQEQGNRNGLTKYYSENRDQTRVLIGLAETGLRDCLPQLDVGDAFEILGKPALLPPSGDQTPSTLDSKTTDGVNAQAARQDLINILSGHAVLMSNSPEAGFAPWSLRYSGHQFGTWAGQLGDGRAISVLVTPHPSDPDLTYELQLKGAGRTPFARSADGLAVLRSSIREFLGAEAIHALQIPSTRSLSLISLPSLPVAREREETACIATRLAPSFMRIGSFEAFNGPANMFFLGGGQQEADWEGLRILGEWVGRRVLKLEAFTGQVEGETEKKAWGKELVIEVARRNAEMVAGWQAYGFMHGVMNTDNISVLGLTIDYGPYAFMDVFDPYHVCNHTDEEGRYAYKYQPNMIIYACRHLLTALSPLIGAESVLGNKAVGPGWAHGASDETIREWGKKGTESLKEEMEILIQETCSAEYGRLMRKRLALRRQDQSDENTLVRPLLDIMVEHRLDFHATFRKISFFKPSLLTPLTSDPSVSVSDPNPNPSALERFISELLSLSPEAQSMDHAKATNDWMAWFEKYSERILSERDAWNAGEDWDKEREKAAKGANPRFVLRQWVLEEVIKKVEEDTESGKKILGKVLKMCCNPFESWGAEDDERPDEKLDAEVREERRYCGMGERAMLGFQCSCSS